MSQSFNEQLWDEFNGRNQSELAAQYGLSTLEIHSRLCKMSADYDAIELLQAVEAVKEAPQHLQALPKPLSYLLVRAVCDKAGFDVGIQLAFYLDRKAA